MEFEQFEHTEDIGFHFGNIATAEARLLMIGDGDWPEGANIRPAIVDVRRPLRLPDLHDWNPSAVARALLDAGVIDAASADTEIVDREQVAAWLKAAGFDGVVYANETEQGGDSLIAFQPGQVRPWWDARTKSRRQIPEIPSQPLPDTLRPAKASRAAG